MNVLSKTTIFPGVTSCVQVDIRCCSVIHQNTHVVPKCGILAPNRRHKLNRVSKKHTVCGKGSEFVVMSPYRHYSPAHMGPRCRVGGGGGHDRLVSSQRSAGECGGLCYQTGGRSVAGPDRTGLEWTDSGCGCEAVRTPVADGKSTAFRATSLLLGHRKQVKVKH